MDEIFDEIVDEQPQEPQIISHKSHKKKKDRELRFIIAQTVVCAIALVIFIGLKFIGGSLFSYAKAVFEKEFNTPINVEQVLDSAMSREIVNAQTVTYGVGGEDDDPNVQYFESYDEVTDDVNDKMKNANTMQKPIDGKVTSEFGSRIHPLSGKQSFHTGIDIGADFGEHIKAALDGTVTSAVEDDEDYGNYIVLTHENGVQTMYAHSEKLLVKEGDKVKKGDSVALVGSTGKSTGPHLHFEIRVNETRLNPRWFLDFD